MIELSEREREIIDHIKEGLSNREIAQKVYVSKKTFEITMSRLLIKCGCRNKAALVSYAYENNLIKNAVNTTSSNNGQG